MKNIISKSIFNLGKILFLIVMVGSFSCTDVDPEIELSTGQPSLQSISAAANLDSAITQGVRGNLYILSGTNLLGTQKVFFNDTEAYFNPALVTEGNIFVSIPDEAPYFDASDIIMVETINGEATLDFSIAQPAPKITSFAPLAASVGDTITIMGSIFEGLESVRFDDVEAEIVSSTTTQIKVKVPEGIVQAFVFVETAGGEARSIQSFGFKFVVYDDVLAEGWWVGGWDGTQDFENTGQVKRGAYSVKRTYIGGYSGFQIGNGGATIDLSDKDAVKVSIFAGENAVRVMLVLNSNYDNGKQIDLVSGVWNDITVPLSELGDPETLNEIVIQEFAGSVPAVIYIDDLGLI